MATDSPDNNIGLDHALDLHIQRLVDAAPPFTPERVARLRALRDAHLASRATTHAEAS